MNSIKLIFSLILLPLFLLGQIPDVKIPQTVKTYFEMNRVGPELVSVDVVYDRQSGRILKLNIVARRNQGSKDLAFAFASAAAVANFAERKFDLLWVEMDVNFKDSETTLALAPANCSIDALILGKTETDKWWKDCLQFP